MKILIVGGGIGGLTTALACQHFHLDYEVFEAAPQIREVGAGIWVPPNAMQVMKRLGVSDAVLERGTLLNSISVGGHRGEKWYSLPTSKVIPKFGFGTVAIHRARLQSLLYQALDKNKVHTAKRLKNFEQDNNEITLHFEDGTKASGNCLIGADGLRSIVRQQLFGNAPLRYSGQTCWRGIVKFRLPDDVKGDMMELWGKSAGQRFAYSQVSENEVYYYATLATPADGKDPEEVKAFLHRYYDTFGSTASAIIDAIDPQTLIRTDLFDLNPIFNWTSNNVALLGDAAHATTPNLGQGAAQSMEDAYVLASVLKNGLQDIPSALKTYQRKRIKKAHYVVNTSWKLGQLANIQNPLIITLRNWMLRATPDFITEKQIGKVYKIDF
jgi:2-polyprenyl-6-methoxyphenol hydroxylase-like FAD-dependent oxidoreductase